MWSTAWGGRAARVAVLLAALGTGSLVIQPDAAAAAVTRGVGQAATAALAPACPALSVSAADDGAAQRLARSCGRPIEAMSGRTPTTRILANPDGTMTSEQSLSPRFVRAADGTWRTADATLRRQPDGGYAPVAALFEMTFSGGGSGPLVTMRKGAASLSLTWPAPLPAPLVSGDTATYREIVAGVDLQVVAAVDGFSHVLVVKSAAAAANPVVAALNVKLSAVGLTLSQSSQGTTEARDASGTALFSSPTPLMWDSSGLTSHVAAMGTALRAGALRLTPAAKMLTDPATVYPVYLDPPWSGGIAGDAWTSVWSRSDLRNSSFWRNGTAQLNYSTKGELGSGEVCDSSSGGSCTSTPYVIRAMMQMTLSGLAGKHLLSAVFDITQGHSWTCNPASNAELWYIDGGISSATTWNNQPSWNGSYTSQAAASHRYQGGAGCAGVGTVEFVATNIVQHALDSGSSVVTVGLRAVSESTVNQWKRWFHSTAVLSATFNSYPTTGAQSTAPATVCVAGNGATPAANAPLINTGTPTLALVTNDADVETDLKGDFDWDTWNGSAWVHGGDLVDAIGRANGGTSVVTPALTDGTFRWRARVDDPWGGGTDYSAYSGWCEFSIDTTPPPVPAVSSADFYPGCEAQNDCGAVGETNRFTIDPGAPDVIGYRWGFSDPPANYIPAPAPGAGVEIDWTATLGGSYNFYAQSVDAAGNTREAPPLPVHVRETRGWFSDTPMNDPAGSTSAADVSPGLDPAPAVGTGVTFGTPGRLVGGDTAVALSGDPASYIRSQWALSPASTGSVDGWFKLADKAATYGLLGQNGNNGLGWALRYDHAADRWVLAVSPDGSACAEPCPTWKRVTSTTAPVAGVWTHIAVSIDEGAGTFTLWVNGVNQGSVSGIAPWQAPGTATVKIGSDGTYGFSGSVADFRTYACILSDTQVRDIVDPLVDGVVGQWHFGEVDGSAAFDSSNYAHDLDLLGGASIPASGAGHDGTGLLLMDGTGSADTESPVLYTDQSFTVSAWAFLTSGSADRTLISQDGVNSSAFAVMFDSTNGGHWAMRGYGADSATAPAPASATAAATAQLNAWVYLTGVYDAPAGQLRLYVDGKLAATQAFAGAWEADGVFAIGRALSEGSGAARWVGDIDEARAYQGVVPQMAGDWRFTQCTGAPLDCADAAVPPHDLILDTTGVSVVANGHDNTSALAFTGAGNGAKTSTGPIAGDQSFTVSAWVNLADGSATRTAVSMDGTAASSLVLGYDAAAGGRWVFGMTGADQNGAAGTYAYSAGASTGTWTHLAGVYDRQQSTVSLYVDGQLVATSTFVSPWNATGGLVVGRDKTSGSATDRWLGTIDDVRAYQGVIPDVSTLM